MSRQKVRIDQVIVPAGTPDGHMPVVDLGELVYQAPAAGSGVVETIVPGTGILVDDTDPANPIVSATGGGGGGASRVLLDSTTLAAAAQSITITGLPGTYTDLLVRCYTKNSTTNSNRYCNFRVGGGGAVDTGSNYDGYTVTMTASAAPSAFKDTGATSMFLRGALPPSGDAFACVEFTIPRYADPSSYRNAFSRSSFFGASGGGVWKNAADAIDTVQVSCLASGENLAAGSVLEVYGIS